MSKADLTQGDADGGLQAVRVPIEYSVPKDLPTTWANNLVIQHQGESFVLHFYEVFPPFILEEGEERLRRAAELKSVEARQVARIVVDSTHIESIIAALTENRKKYLATRERNGDSEDGLPPLDS